MPRGFESHPLRSKKASSIACRPAKVDIKYRYDGEVLEWLNRHAWKACVVLATVGSNPTLSATK